MQVVTIRIKVVAPRSACLCCLVCIGTVVIELNICSSVARGDDHGQGGQSAILSSICLSCGLGWALVLGLNASIVRIEQAMMFRSMVCNYSTICVHSGRELPTAEFE